MKDKCEIYINVSDLGSAIIFFDKRNSNRFLHSESLKKSRIQKHWWVDMELFFTKNHDVHLFHTEQPKLYFVSNIIEVIWNLYVYSIYLKIIYFWSSHLLFYFIR